MKKSHARLRAAMLERGITYEMLKEKGVISMSRSTFSQKLNKNSDWLLHKEIIPMCRFMGTTLSIFLDRDKKLLEVCEKEEVKT